MRPHYLAAFLSLVSLNATQAAIIINSPTTYTENFNSLANSGTSNSITPFGWSFLETGSARNTTYAAGTGSENDGNTYSFGADGSSERAFGGVQSGSVIPTIGASFTNGGATAIESLQISYVGEQWRVGNTGGARADRLNFEYSLNATALTGGTWTSISALDFVSPVQTAPGVGALDGNLAANRTNLSSTLAGLNINVGQTLWIRWTDFNASGSDDGLAIDDFSLTASFAAVPEPSSIAFLLATGLGTALYHKRRRRNDDGPNLSS